MTISELSQNLDKIIVDYETAAGAACQYCSDDITGEAFKVSHDAVANALSSFKAEILAYLSQH